MSVSNLAHRNHHIRADRFVAVQFVVHLRASQVVHAAIASTAYRQQ